MRHGNNDKTWDDKTLERGYGERIWDLRRWDTWEDMRPEMMRHLRDDMRRWCEYETWDLRQYETWDDMEEFKTKFD
jgi:hypothetical protein